LILALALPSVLKSVKLKKHGVSTESTVLTSKRRSSSKGSTTYEVTVSFNTPDGSEATAKAQKRSSISEGEKVMIWYDPAKPQKIDFGDSIGYNMRGVFIGSFLILLGFYLLFRLIIRDSSGMKKIILNILNV